MYVNKFRKANNKKSAYVLLESIVILMIVSCICIAINKIAINNYLKSNVLDTRDDIKTLTLTEEVALLESIKYFNNNSDKNKYELKKPNDYILSPEIYKITIDRNRSVLIKERSNSKGYTEIEMKSIVIDNKNVINIAPKFFKTDYIIN